MKRIATEHGALSLQCYCTRTGLSDYCARGRVSLGFYFILFYVSNVRILLYIKYPLQTDKHAMHTACITKQAGCLVFCGKGIFDGLVGSLKLLILSLACIYAAKCIDYLACHT